MTTLQRAKTSVALAIAFTLWASTAQAHTTYATSYCLRGVMADGSYVRMRSAASDWLPLGTHIRLIGRPFFQGMRRFVIRDTGPALSDGHLDLWYPSCSGAIRWGARPVHFKIGWSKPV